MRRFGCHPHINMGLLTSSCLAYRLYKICDRPVLVNNQAVQRIDARKCLGVLLDKKRSWEKHIETICKKAGAGIGALRRAKPVPKYFIYKLSWRCDQDCVSCLGYKSFEGI